MIKLGIVGLGAIGNRVIQALQEYKQEIEIVAVCDQNESLIKSATEKLDRAKGYIDYQTMLEKETLDLVYVAVPPKFHAQMTLDVLSRGIHVYCEKPLANSVEEAKEMLLAARAAKVVTAMNFPLNYSPSTNKFESLYKEGYIGKLRRIDLNLHFPQWPRSWQQNAWVGGREQGGFTLEVGAHWVQLIQKIFGKVVGVQSELKYPEDPAFSENSIIATLELESGISVHLNGISHIPGEENLQLIAYGTEGLIMLQNWRELKGGKVGEKIADISAEGTPTNRLYEEIIKQIRFGHGEVYDFEVGYEVQVVLEALRNPDSNTSVNITNQYLR